MTNRIRKCCIVLLVLFAAGCDPLDDFEAGPLGAVEIGEDEPVRIRSLFPITGAASSHGASLERAVELAVRDFGSIHGRVVDPGSARGRHVLARGRARRAPSKSSRTGR